MRRIFTPGGGSPWPWDHPGSLGWHGIHTLSDGRDGMLSLRHYVQLLDSYMAPIDTIVFEASVTDTFHVGAWFHAPQLVGELMGVWDEQRYHNPLFTVGAGNWGVPHERLAWASAVDSHADAQVWGSRAERHPDSQLSMTIYEGAVRKLRVALHCPTVALSYDLDLRQVVSDLAEFAR